MYSVFLHFHQCPSYCLPEEGPRLKCSVRVAQCNNEALAWNLGICEGYLFTTLTYPHHSPWPDVDILAVRRFMLQILTCIQCNTSMFNSLVHRTCHCPIFDQYRCPPHIKCPLFYSRKKVVAQECKRDPPLPRYVHLLVQEHVTKF